MTEMRLDLLSSTELTSQERVAETKLLFLHDCNSFANTPSSLRGTWMCMILAQEREISCLDNILYFF